MKVEDRNRVLMEHMRKAVAETSKQYIYRPMNDRVIDDIRANVERVMRDAGAEGVVVHTNFDVRPRWWQVARRFRLWLDRKRGRVHVNIAYRMEPPTYIEFQIQRRDEVKANDDG